MRVLLFIVFGSVIASCSIHKLNKLGVYEEQPPAVYLSYVNDSTVNIIDVRTLAEYDKSHIRGAVNVNFFKSHFRENLRALNLDTSKTTLIYCETQHRSLFVAKKLYKEGFHNVIDLDRGMMHWRKKGFPYVED